jgi:hypothetical protein
MQRYLSCIIVLLLLTGSSANAASPVQRSLPQQQLSARETVWFGVIRSQMKERTGHTAPLSVAQMRATLLKRYRERTGTQEPQVVAPTPRVPTLSPVIDQADIQQNQKLIADQALRLMPKRCQSSLKNFYVRYDNPSNRGLGGKSTMILTGNVTDSEFRALFLHEFGHIIDLGCLQGDSRTGSSTFADGKEQMFANDPSVLFYTISWKDSHTQRGNVSPEDFVSGYASWDAFEDFAESFAYYMLHREVFAERAQENSSLAAKYQWFMQHLPELPTVATSTTVWNGNVPWDVTKLSYEWNAEVGTVARR